MFKKQRIFIFIILALSALTHFAYFGHPNQTVFDEVHFGKFISGYFTGEYFFDIHPPLGKLLISAAGYLTGFKPGFSFANIGETFPDKNYILLRLLPALAGFLLPLVIYGLAKELKFSATVSLAAALLIVFENALIVQSRLMLLDSFLLLFGFTAIWCYLRYRSKKLAQESAFGYLLAGGILGGLALSIKWTGAGFLGLIILFQIVDWLGLEGSFREKTKEILKNLVALILAPLVVYMAIFAIHFALLPKSGPGDAFMSPEFQKTLAGNIHNGDDKIKKINWFQKFTELNTQMYSSNQRLTAHHPYGSKWYSWPFMTRSIYYWNKSLSGAEEKIYLLGNPLIWWSSTLAILLLATNMILGWFKKKAADFPSKFLLAGYTVNLLPFIGIGRVMFLYHYFTSLIFAILGLAYLLNKSQNKKAVMLVVVSAIIAFLYFAPFTYGFPLTSAEQSYLFWFPSWR